eukprot:3465948-Karenia_brevis.AAC.1
MGVEKGEIEIDDDDLSASTQPSLNGPQPDKGGYKYWPGNLESGGQQAIVAKEEGGDLCRANPSESRTSRDPATSNPAGSEQTGDSLEVE